MSSSQDVSSLQSVGSCLLYAGTAITLSMANKSILSQYGFSCVFFLLACQLSVALIVVNIFKFLSRSGFESVPAIPDFSVSTWKKSLKLVGLFVANVTCGFVGLRLVDVPLFLCLRRTTSVAVMLVNYFYDGKVDSLEIRAAVSVIMLGTLLAGYETLSINYVGYTFAIANNVLTAFMYREQGVFTREAKVSNFGLLFYNALSALPICLVLSYLAGEGTVLSTYTRYNDPGFFFALLLSSCLGLLLTYAVVLCNTVNSPLATAVTGNIKDILASIIGWIIFGGFVATPLSVTGLFTSFVGAGAFSYIKLKSVLQKTTTAPSPMSVRTPSLLSSPDVTKSSPAPTKAFPDPDVKSFNEPTSPSHAYRRPGNPV